MSDLVLGEDLAQVEAVGVPCEQIGDCRSVFAFELAETGELWFVGEAEFGGLAEGCGARW